MQDDFLDDSLPSAVGFLPFSCVSVFFNLLLSNDFTSALVLVASSLITAQTKKETNYDPKHWDLKEKHSKIPCKTAEASTPGLSQGLCNIKELVAYQGE